jgi:hypothetical protein
VTDDLDILADLADDAGRDELRAALNRALRLLARARAKTEDLVDAVYRAAGDALIAEGTRETPAPILTHGGGGPEHALWHLTDWQGGKRTVSYSSEVMRSRVHRFVDRAERITAIQRADHPVPDCTILFGGDILEGLFNFPTQPFEVDATLFEQWGNVSTLMAEVVRRALAMHDHVTVVSEWGNHGRIGSQRDAVPRSDNLDRMAYATAKLVLAGETRLTWEDGPEDIQKVEIGNYRALLLHGDEVGRHGYVSEKSFLTYLNKLKAGSFGWSFRDAYSGHRHTHDEWAMADGTGAWYQTGSTESDNRYARDGLGSAAQPSQRLHFIEPEKGFVSAQYKIHLGESA